MWQYLRVLTAFVSAGYAGVARRELKEVNFLLFLYHFNWAGTPEELREYVGHMKSIVKGTQDVKFMGLFIPTSEWHYALVMDTPSYEKALQVMKTYVTKFGWGKASLAKVELLHTFEELGLKE